MLFHHDISPIAVSLGQLEIRWYGILFASGVLLAYAFVRYIFKLRKYNPEHLDSLFVYIFVGILVGARLGHVFFYRAEYFLSNPLEIVKFWQGGLASHGAAIGVFIAYWLWCRFNKEKFGRYANEVVLGAPIVGIFVRLGNFFNSEIVGHPTNAEWGVVFERLGEDFARHPVQLYESVLNVFVFLALIAMYRKWQGKTSAFFFVAWYLILYFGGRFFVEFFKDLHGPLPIDFPLTMGQVLSALAVFIGLGYLFLNRKKSFN